MEAIMTNKNLDKESKDYLNIKKEMRQAFFDFRLFYSRPPTVAEMRNRMNYISERFGNIIIPDEVLTRWHTSWKRSN